MSEGMWMEMQAVGFIQASQKSKKAEDQSLQTEDTLGTNPGTKDSRRHNRMWNSWSKLTQV